MTKVSCSVPDPRVPLILAANVIVVVDDGAFAADDYSIMERIAAGETHRYPNGLACLIIVPPNARPPREEIRDAIRTVLGNLGEHLASVCWYLEGTGFKGAAARAVVSGLVMLIKPRYPSRVASDLTDALTWSFAKAGAPDGLDLHRVARQVRELRNSVDRTRLRPAPI